MKIKNIRKFWYVIRKEFSPMQNIMFPKLTQNQKVTTFTSIIGFIGIIIAAVITRAPQGNSSVTSPILDSAQISAIQNANKSKAQTEASGAIRFIQFTINEEICPCGVKEVLPMHSASIADQGTFINKEFASDSIYFVDCGGQDKRRIQNYSGNPVFDLTVWNSSKVEVVLTSININLRRFGLWQGDASPKEAARTIEVLNRYKVAFPDQLKLREIFEGYYGLDENDKKVKGPTLKIKKAAIPPILIPADSPSRFQLEILPNATETGHYSFEINFEFSNGEVLHRLVDLELYY